MSSFVPQLPYLSAVGEREGGVCKHIVVFNGTRTPILEHFILFDTLWNTFKKLRNTHFGTPLEHPFGTLLLIWNTFGTPLEHLSIRLIEIYMIFSSYVGTLFIELVKPPIFLVAWSWFRKICQTRNAQNLFADMPVKKLSDLLKY